MKFTLLLLVLLTLVSGACVSAPKKMINYPVTVMADSPLFVDTPAVTTN